MKIGRNAPCHCGSGKKYKKCCLRKDAEKSDSPPSRPDDNGVEAHSDWDDDDDWDDDSNWNEDDDWDDDEDDSLREQWDTYEERYRCDQFEETVPEISDDENSFMPLMLRVRTGLTSVNG